MQADDPRITALDRIYQEVQANADCTQRAQARFRVREPHIRANQCGRPLECLGLLKRHAVLGEVCSDLRIVPGEPQQFRTYNPIARANQAQA